MTAKQLAENAVGGISIAEQLSVYGSPGSSIIFLPLWDFQQGRWVSTPMTRTPPSWTSKTSETFADGFSSRTKVCNRDWLD